MKRIFGIAWMMVMMATGLHAQNYDNNASANNTVAGNSDDSYYSNNDNGNVANNGNNQVVYNNANDGPDNYPAPTEQTFHDQLSPYGNWVQNPTYGQVWVPTQVSADFTPYATGGHWVNSQYGWTWMSDYAWGWAPFHYGRWLRDNVYGWEWVPGYDWAAAWVAWGDYGDYYCWAPLMPGYTWSAYCNYRPPFYCWNFVPHAYIGCGRLGGYLVDRGRLFHGGAVNIHMINESAASRNGHFYAGPRAAEVEHYTGQHVERVNVNSVHNLTSAHFNGNTNHATQANRNTNGNQQMRGQQQLNHANTQVQQHATQNENTQHQSLANQQNYRGQQVQQRTSGGQNVQHQNSAAQANYNRSQPAQQHYAQNQSRPAQANYSRSQPVQSNANRSFASAQRSNSVGSATRSGSNSGGSHGGGSGGHGRSR
jgi:hypothetical protein